MKNNGLQKSLSLLLCLLLVIGMLPITAHGWDNYVQCEYCGAGCGDDYICSGGDHCSEDSGRDCYNEHHCLDCGECEDSASDWCEVCHMCGSCAESNFCHCSDCGICGVDAGTLCEGCGKCYECGGECTEGTEHLCAECHENEGVGVCDICGACGLDTKLCEECGQCYECGGECSSGTEHMCLDCHIYYGSACPECWKCSAEYADDEFCPDCGTCMDCAANHCMLCFRCGNCVELCERCDEQCVDCHQENDLGPDDQYSPCPYCGKCKDDGTPFCYECGTCQECMDICEDCSLCTDCIEALDAHCTECGICGEVTELCADGGDHCVDCCADNDWLCPDCGGCTETLGLERCRDCMRCEDCMEICDLCGGICIECAIEEELHCPGCGGCYEGDGLMHCYECMMCEDCVGQICDHDLCADCGIPDGHHCPDCWQCGYELDRCGDCGRCVDCCLCEIEGFNDVAEGVYYHDPVLWAVKRGITSGTGEGLFSPGKTCNRAQVVTFLWSYAGKPRARTSSTFVDVPSNAYYYEAVNWAVEQGITAGTSPTTFSPSKECSRAAIVTFLWSFMGRPAARGSNPFTDVTAKDYFHNAVLWAAEEGITSGTGGTNFSPYKVCTRGQVVTFLYKCPKFLTIRLQPADHRMTSSQEDAEFTVSIVGGVAPYTYEWVLCCDNDESWYQPERTNDTVSVLREEFTDYMFEDYNNIGVYCVITDRTGSSVTTQLAEVFSNNPVRIVNQPADYHMGSSQEEAVFTVSVAHGTALYSYEWVVCYDGREVWHEPEVTGEKSSTFRVELSDYDFEECDFIYVYCVITDAAGNCVTTRAAEVYPYTPFKLVTQPADYQMQSSQEDAVFTVSVAGGVAPYTYEWVTCYGYEEVWYQRELTHNTGSTFSVEITDYDFEDYNDIVVYCIITDSKGSKLESELANVLPH